MIVWLALGSYKNNSSILTIGVYSSDSLALKACEKWKSLSNEQRITRIISTKLDTSLYGDF